MSDTQAPNTPEDSVRFWVAVHEHRYGISIYGFRAIGFDPTAQKHVLQMVHELDIDLEEDRGEDVEFFDVTDDLGEQHAIVDFR